ncbi:MAG: CHAD domain-containing protein [Gallionella sp.]|jgi:inorganic triphosphatase YgiF
MAIETELKLRLSAEQLAQLRRHALFKTHQITVAETRRLHNIYYDTPTLDLHKSKMALRLRRVGGKWLQTLKGGGQVKAGMHQRFEWEVPVPSAKLDFSNLDTSVWDEHLPPAWRDSLQPVFVTDFYRSSRLLDWQGAIIEVCMDHGEVKTSDLSSPICEVELELKSGEPQQLFELAQAILAVVSFELEEVSKAEKGFRLLSGYIAHPVKGNVPKLARSDSLTDGMQTMIWSCLLHFQGNLHGAMTGCDAEYLHQMRVALRRLRVVLRMCEKIRADEVLTILREELAVLGVTLGRLREWDVFITQTLNPMRCTIEGNIGQQCLQALLEASSQCRADCYASLRTQSRELQGMMLRFAIWMNGSYWQQAAGDAPNLCEFANKRLHQLARRYANAGLGLHTLDAQQLHALRIYTKKLRYSAEFFASLYPVHQAKSYLAALGEMQELLGQINDIAVADRLLDDLAGKLPGNLAAHREVIVFIKRVINSDLSIKFNLLQRIGKRFNKHRVFWGK